MYGVMFDGMYVWFVVGDVFCVFDLLSGWVVCVIEVVFDVGIVFDGCYFY